MGETPTFKRCCFCVPLRHGLLVWSYVKLIANFFLIPILIYTAGAALLPPLFSGNKSIIWLIFIYFAMAAVTVIMFLADYVATIVFIIGVHKRKLDLIKGYYIFSIGMLIVTLLLIATSVILSLVCWLISYDPMLSWDILGSIIIIGFILIIAIQIYVILLIKSEIFNLTDNRSTYSLGYEPCMKCDEVAEGQNITSKVVNV